jgi:transcription elongation GreA/GreB family factor
MQVVDRLPSDTSKIYFGAWVELRHGETGDSYTYRIVGPDEIDQDPAYISIDSPMAKALIGKLEGDEISILQTTQNSKVLSFEKTPDPTEYDITRIWYTEV